MIDIKPLEEGTLWDLASFCCRQPEREDTYVPGDRERFQEGYKRKAAYLKRKLPQGARAQIAYVGDQPVGFIEYYPIEITNLELEGEDIMAIWCIHVREERRGGCIGSMLVKACLEDARKLGRKGVAVTCWDPFWMPREIFLQNGFQDVGPAGPGGRILLRSFEPVREPKWIERKLQFHPEADNLVMDLYYTVRCPIHWRNVQLMKEIAGNYGPLVEVREHRTDDRTDMRRHGTACSTYLDGELIAAGPMVDKENIQNKIQAALDRRKENSGR